MRRTRRTFLHTRFDRCPPPARVAGTQHRAPAQAPEWTQTLTQTLDTPQVLDTQALGHVLDTQALEVLEALEEVLDTQTQVQALDTLNLLDTLDIWRVLDTQPRAGALRPGDHRPQPYAGCARIHRLTIV